MASVGGEREIGHFGRTKGDEKELFSGVFISSWLSGHKRRPKKKEGAAGFCFFFSSQKERKDLYFSAKREKGMLKARRREDKLFV